MSKTFKLHDLVRWASQVAGRKTTKEGEVVEIIPPKTVPKDVHGVSRHQVGREHESYVVLVEKKSRNPKRPKKPARYWPIVSKLIKFGVTVPQAEPTPEDAAKLDGPPVTVTRGPLLKPIYH